MQFLLEKIENGDFLNHPKVIGEFIKHNLLEKEKEQMRLADKNGEDRNQYKHDCEYGGAEYWDIEPKSFEEYYNEMFNTKHK